MMKKKNPKLELESSRKIFFQLGLFIVGSATLMAFSYKTPVYLKEKKEVVERTADIPILIVEKEPLPKVEILKENNSKPKTEPSTPIFSTDLLNKLKKVKNTNKKQKLAVTTQHLQSVSSGNFSVDMGEAPEAAIVDYPDFDAEFQGNWLSYLRNTVKYPEESIRFNESGTAYVSFVVEIDGTITDVEVKNKSLSSALQKEAIRVIKASPKWKPGSKNGEFVRSTKIVKINFILE
ncbi:energy transducer TonB [Brumimicrobium oceani]|nr:energy transducer TonB [Brumimicrobium oceani]